MCFEQITNAATDEALLQQAQLSQLPRPEKHDTRLLQEWLRRKKGGDLFLKGIEDGPYLEGEEDDLVVVSPRGFDSVTNLVASQIVPWLFRRGVQKKASFIY